jgi:hypothetical protein
VQLCRIPLSVMQCSAPPHSQHAQDLAGTPHCAVSLWRSLHHGVPATLLRPAALLPADCNCRSGSPLDPGCDPSAHKLAADARHYLVIDTNVALHQVRCSSRGEVAAVDCYMCSCMGLWRYSGQQAYADSRLGSNSLSWLAPVCASVCCT